LASSYDPVTGDMDFSLALKSLKRGGTVARRKWGGSLCVYLNHLNTPVIEGYGGMGQSISLPWEPWGEDIMAPDWVEVMVELHKEAA